MKRRWVGVGGRVARAASPEHGEMPQRAALWSGLGQARAAEAWEGWQYSMPRARRDLHAWGKAVTLSLSSQH